MNMVVENTHISPYALAARMSVSDNGHAYICMLLPHLFVGESVTNGSQNGVECRFSTRAGRVEKNRLPPVVAVQQPVVVLLRVTHFASRGKSLKRWQCPRGGVGHIPVARTTMTIAETCE